MTKSKVFLATWLNFKLKEVACLHVCTPPPSILEHLNVALKLTYLRVILHDHYRQLSTRGFIHVQGALHVYGFTWLNELATNMRLFSFSF